jgi:formate hydrogenlyase subunit 3/multisubunit Na+/H+ antiporter MnhD subunit
MVVSFHNDKGRIMQILLIILIGLGYLLFAVITGRVTYRLMYKNPEILRDDPIPFLAGLVWPLVVPVAIVCFIGWRISTFISNLIVRILGE